MQKEKVSDFDADHIQSLTKILQAVPEVQKYNIDGHQEAPTLALALNDIAEACERVLALEKLLVSGTSQVDIYDTLHAIREELRHIIYHVQDSHFCNSLIP